jgi:chromosomal replication initiator protein
MTTDHEQLREATIKSIQEAVARQFGLSVEELRQEPKQRMVVIPRHIAIYLTKQMTDASLTEIGKNFGGRHHTTVMHSIANVHKLRRSDAALDDLITKLMKSLLQS